MLPNFIIVGAMKGGTSSLAHMLGMHPEIYIPRKEVHFFNVDDRYNLGLDHYRSYFIESNGKPIIGEKTPTYSYQENVPERIVELLPDAKIIWIFREPVARAYSHYWFFVSMGKERLSFEKRLEREDQGKVKDFTMNYRDRSIYITQVDRYLKYFSREQMLFLKFEDFKRAPWEVLLSICEFLDVDLNYQFPELPTRVNVTHIPCSILFQWLMYRICMRKGARILRVVKKINRRKVEGYPKMQDNLRIQLEEFYAPFNKLLGERTGLDLSDWELTNTPK